MGDDIPAGRLVDPGALHILLVDTNWQSRQNIAASLTSCNYQVTSCKTSQEAIQLLKAQQGPEGTANFDLILKEHSPASGTNACRFLRRAQTDPVLRGIPIIVASSSEDRSIMVNCLQLGAADYMLKPLRTSDLRNLWARVYWWRRASYLQPLNGGQGPASLDSDGHGSEETQRNSDEPEEAQHGRASREESALTENGSAGEQVENGSKDNLDWSGSLAKQSLRDSTNATDDSEKRDGQGSNHPSTIPFQAAPGAGLGPQNPAPTPQGTQNTPGQESQNLKPNPLPCKGTNTDLNKESVQRNNTGSCDLPRSSSANDAPSGFRAYVASAAPIASRKRSLPESSFREEFGGSSGSDWTGSLEKMHENKRQATMSRLVSAPLATGNVGAKKAPEHLNSAGVPGSRAASQQLPKPTQVQVPNPTKGSDMERKSSAEANRTTQTSAAGSSYPYFGFGMMPPPFAMPPQFWSQAAASAQQSRDMPMPMFFSPFQQGQAGMGLGQSAQPQSGQQSAQQGQQLALQMYQHSMMMQQYGMPVPPFMPFPAFNQAAAQAQQNIQDAEKQRKQQNNAGQRKAPNPNQAGQGLTGKPQAGRQPVMSREQSNAPSGPAGTAATKIGESTGDTQRENNFAQVGLDGCLIEPTRQQRRAEALQKYKQKRKNLNFTKKIRYESRKQLAQARPRVKGQFVRVRSDEVDAVVNAMTPLEMDNVADGNTPVPATLLETAIRGDADNTPPGAATIEDTKDVEISEEDVSGDMDGQEEDDDASSPALQDVPKASCFPPTTEAAAKLEEIAAASHRNISASGSNSPEPEPEPEPAGT